MTRKEVANKVYVGKAGSMELNDGTPKNYGVIRLEEDKMIFYNRRWLDAKRAKKELPPDDESIESILYSDIKSIN